jgi:hypothetical protein
MWIMLRVHEPQAATLGNPGVYTLLAPTYRIAGLTVLYSIFSYTITPILVYLYEDCSKRPRFNKKSQLQVI